MNFVVNGEKAYHGVEEITYEEVATLAGYKPNQILSVVYQGKKNGDSRRSGTLSPGKTTKLEDGMVFSVADTSNA